MSFVKPPSLFTAQAMKTPQTLGTAFNMAVKGVFSQGQSNLWLDSDSDQGKAIIGLGSDLYQIANTLRTIDFDSGNELQKRVKLFAVIDGEMHEGSLNVQRVKTNATQIEELLIGIKEESFEELTKKMADQMVDGGASVHTELSASVVPSLEGGFEMPDIVIGGEELDLELGHVHPRVEDPSKRIPINMPVVDQARTTLTTAIDSYLKGRSYSSQQVQQVRAHFEALVSGEIDAAAMDRLAVIKFMAKGVGHSLGYAEQLLSEAMMAELLGEELITLIPDLGDVMPKDVSALVAELAKEKKEKERADRAQPVVGSPRELLRKLKVLAADHPEVMAALIEANPGAYGDLSLLDSLPGFLEATSPQTGRNKAREFAEAQAVDFIPNGFIGGDKVSFNVSDLLPTSGVPATVQGRVIDIYLASSNYEKALATRVDDSKYPLEDRLNVLLRDLNVNSSYVQKIVEIKDMMSKDFTLARVAYLRLKLGMMKNAMDRVNAEGITAMNQLHDRFNTMIEQGSYSEAEVLLNYAKGWLEKMEEKLAEVRETIVNILMIGDRDAATQFEQYAKGFLKAEDYTGLKQFVKRIYEECKPLEIILSARSGLLHQRVTGTAVTLIESIRTLALASATDVKMLAAKIPSVEAQLRFGATGPDAARANLREWGIPVPGDKDVAALGTAGVAGYLPEAMRKDRLLADGNGTAGEKK
ncbi:MAG: hypothetical protein ABIE74_02640 [Pseudomonadota bacterium]